MNKHGNISSANRFFVLQEQKNEVLKIGFANMSEERISMDVLGHAKTIKNIADDLTPEEVYQARLIVARQKFWTQDIEKLLRKWRRQITNLQMHHKTLEATYNRRYYLLGVPASILSTVVASGVLTTFKNCNTCTIGCVPEEANSGSCGNDEWVRLSMGILGIFAIIFTCLSVFLNYGQASRDNKATADDFSSLARKIDTIMDTPVSAREDPITFLNGIRTEFDDISKNSPVGGMPKISLEYRTVGEIKTGPPRPDQVNFAKKKKIPDASSLAKILMDNLENEEKERTLVQEKVHKENDHDTDEEKDVAIAFDLDELRPEDLLKNDRRAVVQQSLTRALEFELSRMYNDPEPSNDNQNTISPLTGAQPNATSPRKKKKVKKSSPPADPPKEKEEV